MLFKQINLPTNPSSDTGGRPKGSPITYAKTCGIVKDFPYAVCTFDDVPFNPNEFLDGALLQCTVNANGELCPPSDPDSRPYYFFVRSASRNDDGTFRTTIFSKFDRTSAGGFDAGEYQFDESLIDAIFSGPFSRNGVLLYPNILQSVDLLNTPSDPFAVGRTRLMGCDFATSTPLLPMLGAQVPHVTHVIFHTVYADGNLRRAFKLPVEHFVGFAGFSAAVPAGMRPANTPQVFTRNFTKFMTTDLASIPLPGETMPFTMSFLAAFSAARGPLTVGGLRHAGDVFDPADDLHGVQRWRRSAGW